MMKFRIFPIVLCLLAISLPAHAAEPQGWAVSLGAFDLADDSTPEAGVEHRFSPIAVKNLDRIALVPAAGLSGTSDGGVWIYGSLRLDWNISERWVVTPHVGVSLFDEGDGKDLGGLVEFRSGFEISYRLGRGSRLGVLFYHLSNARIYDDNPGSNTLALVWAIGR